MTSHLTVHMVGKTCYWNLPRKSNWVPIPDLHPEPEGRQSPWSGLALPTCRPWVREKCSQPSLWEVSSPDGNPKVCSQGLLPFHYFSLDISKMKPIIPPPSELLNLGAVRNSSVYTTGPCISSGDNVKGFMAALSSTQPFRSRKHLN